MDNVVGPWGKHSITIEQLTKLCLFIYKNVFIWKWKPWSPVMMLWSFVFLSSLFPTSTIFSAETVKQQGEKTHYHSSELVTTGESNSATRTQQVLNHDDKTALQTNLRSKSRQTQVAGGSKQVTITVVLSHFKTHVYHCDVFLVPRNLSRRSCRTSYLL